MEATINIEGTPGEVMAKKQYLETICKNLTKENLQFISELSKKPNINSKLESKKSLITNFV